MNYAYWISMYYNANKQALRKKDIIYVNSSDYNKIKWQQNPTFNVSKQKKKKHAIPLSHNTKPTWEFPKSNRLRLRYAPAEGRHGNL